MTYSFPSLHIADLELYPLKKILVLISLTLFLSKFLSNCAVVLSSGGGGEGGWGGVGWEGEITSRMKLKRYTDITLNK